LVLKATTSSRLGRKMAANAGGLKRPIESQGSHLKGKQARGCGGVAWRGGHGSIKLSNSGKGGGIASRLQAEKTIGGWVQKYILQKRRGAFCCPCQLPRT